MSPPAEEMNQQPFTLYEEESQSSKLIKKARDSPYVPIGGFTSMLLVWGWDFIEKCVTGLAGCVGAVAYGIAKYKNRGTMSTSVYLMKFRVVAQSMGVLTLGVGVVVSMVNEHLLPKLMKNDSSKKN